jgi:hypothetical protein
MINFKPLFSGFIVLSLLLITVACESTIAQNKNSNDSSKEIAIVTCTEPRPQICTNEYKPVCATLENGKNEIYATGCTACADKFVISYRKDVCEKVE